MWGRENQIWLTTWENIEHVKVDQRDSVWQAGKSEVGESENEFSPASVPRLCSVGRSLF